MTLPVNFGSLAAGNQSTTLFDTQFNALGAASVIACTATGSNAVVLTPATNYFSPTGYTDSSPFFTWVQQTTSTGPVTINVAGLGALNAYKLNGSAVLGSGDIVTGQSYICMYNHLLNAGAGGFVVNVEIGAGGFVTEAPIDGLLYGRQNSAWHQAVARAGDTMTGNLIIAPASGGTMVELNKSASGLNNIISGYTAGLQRWTITIGSAIAESGSNAGSNFTIDRYTDAGAYIDSPVSIIRSTGIATFTSTNFIVQSPGTVPAITLGSGGATWGQVYYDGGAGTFVMTNVVGSGSNLTLLSNGNFQVSAATALKPGGGAWTATSDARIKTVTAEFERGLAAIEQLRPKRFTYKGNDGSTHAVVAQSGREFIGLVAQECEDVIPELVTQVAGEIDGVQVSDLRTLDPSPLVHALINAVKELSARVQALESR